MKCLFHKWGSWSKPKKACVTRSNIVGDSYEVSCFIQERFCSRCGRLDWIKV